MKPQVNRAASLTYDLTEGAEHMAGDKAANREPGIQEKDTKRPVAL